MRLRAPHLRLTSGGRIALAVIVLLLGGAATASSQVEAEAAPGFRARPLVDLDLRITELAGTTRATGGVRALLEVLPWLRIGAGVHRVLASVDDSEEVLGPGSRLKLGYAGGVIESELPRLPLRLRVLAGAGVATVRDRAVGTKVGSDVFGVAVPELAHEPVRWGPVSLGVSVGYLFVFRSDGPGRLTPADLTSANLSISLRLGPF